MITYLGSRHGLPLLTLLFGAISLTRLPIQLTPEVEEPQITITTAWRAAAPEEVESVLSDHEAQDSDSIDDILPVDDDDRPVSHSDYETDIDL